jgi:hypothetical protein
MQSKYESILRNRALKREANQQMRQTRIEKEEAEQIAKEEELARQEELWAEELARRTELKAREQEELAAEQGKIQRQQQYLGVAAEQVAMIREQQMNLAKERQLRGFQKEAIIAEERARELRQRETENKKVLYRHTVLEEEIQQREREKESRFEKKASIARRKEEICYKKDMFVLGQEQHAATKTVLEQTNPYAARISDQLRTTASASSQLQSRHNHTQLPAIRPRS